jgi:hypothetical protein
VRELARLDMAVFACCFSVFRYWEEFLAELRRATSSKFGAEFIDDCMSMDVSEVKLKYGA